MPYRKMWWSPWVRPWLKDDWNPFPTGKMSPWASWCESLPDGDVSGVYGQHPKLPDGGFGRWLEIGLYCRTHAFLRWRCYTFWTLNWLWYKWRWSDSSQLLQYSNAGNTNHSTMFLYSVSASMSVVFFHNGKGFKFRRLSFPLLFSWGSPKQFSSIDLARKVSRPRFVYLGVSQTWRGAVSQAFLDVDASRKGARHV